MDPKELLLQIAGEYEVRKLGKILEGDPSLRVYFPPVGTRRVLRPALVNAVLVDNLPVDNQWVGKFRLQLPEADSEFAPLKAKIEAACYRVASDTALVCERIDVKTNTYIRDDIKLDTRQGQLNLVHEVRFFNLAGQLQARGMWICPKAGGSG